MSETLVLFASAAVCCAIGLWGSEDMERYCFKHYRGAVLARRMKELL